MAKQVDFSAEADAVFFASYDALAVHEKMIKDKVRTQSYQDAIENNPHLFRDKIVLDIGTGTGILSMFAVRAGAKHVYATDVSNMIDNARSIADRNGMSNDITFIKGRVEDAKLPPVDIIVSEWMGFCLLSEIMLDCLLQARDKYLVPGGLMFPDKCSLYIAGIEDAERLSSKVDYWDNVYGLDFSPVKAAAISKGFLRTPEPGAVITEPSRVLNLDLQTIQMSDPLPDRIPFKLVSKRNDTVHAFLAWFDYAFTNGRHSVHVSTGPFTPPTHWKQTVFYLEKPIYLEEHAAIQGQVSFEQHQRDLNVRIWYDKDTKTLGNPNGVHDTKVNSNNTTTRGYGLYKVDAIE